MQNETQATKTCVLCGEDCSRRQRVRDERGNYYCAYCHDRALEHQAGRRASRDEHATMIAELIAEPPATPACTRCGNQLMPGAVLCTNCGLDRRSGRCFESAVERPVDDVSVAPAAGRWDRVLERQAVDAARAARREYFIPAAMLVLGVGVVLALRFILNGNAAPGALVGGYLIGLGIEVVVGVVGLFVAARLWLGGAGPLPLGILRLAGIYAVVDAVSIVVSPLLGFGWVIRLGVYLGLLSWLFDMDLRDSAMLGIITFALKIAVGFALVALAFGM